MTTAAKLWLGFGVLTALVVLTNVAIVLRVRSIEAEIVAMSQVARPRSDEATELRVNLIGFVLAVRTFGQVAAPESKREAIEKAANVDTHLAEYERLTVTERDQELVAGFRSRWQALNTLGQTFLNTPADKLTRDDWLRLARQRVDLETFLIKDMGNDASDAFAAQNQAAVNDIRTIERFALVLVIVGVFIAIVTGVTVGKGVVKNEREIRSRREQLRATLASIGDAVITTGTDGRITSLNSVAETLTGWTNSQAEGRSLEKVFHIINEHTRRRVSNPAERALEEGAPVDLARNTVLIARDGSETPIDDSTAPILDSNGKRVGCVLVFRDISERRHEESRLALLARLGEIRRLAEGPDDLLYAVSQAVGETFGVRRSLFNEIDLENDIETVHRDYCRGVPSVAGTNRISDYSPQTLADMRAGRTVVNRDSLLDPRTAGLYEKVYAPVGERAYVAVPLMRGGKWVASLWISDDVPRNWTDVEIRLLESIGERSWLAVEKLRGEAALRDSERRFREMIDALPMAIYTTDAEGRLTHFNPAAVKFSGRVPELGTDRWCVSWRLYNADGSPLPHDKCPMAVALKEGRAITGVEAIAERPDGQRRWFTPYPTPLRDSKGKVVGGINMLLDITERKETEKAVAHLAAIIESTDDAVISKDLNGIISSWNNAAERIFGYSAAEAIGNPVTMLIPPDRLDEEASILERIRSGKIVDHYETSRRRKDGSEIRVSLTVSPIRDDSGKVIGASKIARDITQARAIEAALRQSDERFTGFMRHLPGLAWIKDLDGRYIYANDAAVTTFDTPRDELYGRTDAELFPAVIADQFRENDLQAVAEGVGVQTIETLEHDDGLVHHSLVHKFPILSPAGQPTLIGGMAIDITERKMAEDALRASEERRQLAQNAGNVGIFDWDIVGDKTYWSETMWSIYGEGRLDLNPDESFWGEHLHPDDAERVKLNIHNVVEGKDEDEFRDEYRIVTNDGAIRWIEAVAEVSRDAEGKAIRMYGVNLDITDKKNQADELQRAHDELEVRVAARTVELADVNKKLRAENAQRLRVEREAVRLLKQIVTIQEEERTRIARDLHDELGQRLTALRLKLKAARDLCKEKQVSDEIDATQAIAEQIDADVGFLAWELRPAALADAGLPATLDSYIKEWRRFSSVKAELHAKGFNGVRLAPETEINLYRIVQEALNNVHKYARAQNASVLIEQQKYDISLIIEDDGVGFDPEKKSARRNGLGLTGMRERAALLGGRIEIESSPGAGTTIFVRVPKGARDHD